MLVHTRHQPLRNLTTAKSALAGVAAAKPIVANSPTIIASRIIVLPPNVGGLPPLAHLLPAAPEGLRYQIHDLHQRCIIASCLFDSASFQLFKPTQRNFHPGANGVALLSCQARSVPSLRIGTA